jgi:hypothetical protein
MNRVTKVLRHRPRLARASVLATLAVALGGLGTATARADFSQYGIESVGASLSTLQAGGHPDVTTEINLKLDSSKEFPQPFADTKDVSIELPPGLTANPTRFPTCPLVTFVASAPIGSPPCTQDAQVGVVEVRLTNPEYVLHEPLYNLPAPSDDVARLGFIAAFIPIFLEVDLRSGSDYGLTVRASGVENQIPINSIHSKTWGVPANPVHDTERLTPLEALICEDGTPCFVGGSRTSALSPEPFMTNPASCGPASFGFALTAYQLPGQLFTASASAGDIAGCQKVQFHPALAIAPTSHRAGAPTGLETDLTMPQSEAVNTLGTSPLRSARVILPEGMTVNSSAADGLTGCSPEQVGYRTENPASCPDGAKLGSASIVSPALRRPIEGGIYLRTPEPGHLVRFWLVADELGVHLKVPADVELDPRTGRLTIVISESPQLPAEEVVMRLNGGARAPLRNPQSCGTSNASYELGPWSGNPAAVGVVPIAIDEGCNTGGFDPKLAAGTVSPVAGGYSPLVFDVSREDGEQNIASIDVSLPAGVTAKLAGVPLCPEALAPTGACPASSEIGVVNAAVGAGTLPLWIPQAGKAPTAVFLAGPYGTAPYSVVAKVPAQAGPFYLGIVTVRSGIYVDPATAQVTAKSEPLPQILEGVPIDYRHVGVSINRSRFALNPTSCRRMDMKATISSSGGAIARPSDRFQAADCASLGFSPKLGLRLKGATQRGGHPRLRAVLSAKPGEANVRRVSVALPHSEFLEQAHIRTVCTRVQFAAEACPAGSVYGHARAFTPLLDRPLEGPVYLRSSSHKLPDLVADLSGQVRITLAGRIDSIRGGLRTTFEALPDVPVSKFVLEMQGGRKGLLVNSRNICNAANATTVNMDGQNGRLNDIRPVLKNDCSGKGR